MNRGASSVRIGLLVVLASLLAMPTLLGETKTAVGPRASANVDNDRKSKPGGEADGEPNRKRQREGASLVDVTGSFRARGERYLFRHADTAREYRVLENLALERVTRAIGTHAEDRLWTVSGTFTEYYGENLLLITRAVLKAHTNDPTGPCTASLAPRRRPARCVPQVPLFSSFSRNSRQPYRLDSAGAEAME